jgi:hypothetical protein
MPSKTALPAINANTTAIGAIRRIMVRFPIQRGWLFETLAGSFFLAAAASGD